MRRTWQRQWTHATGLAILAFSGGALFGNLSHAIGRDDGAYHGLAQLGRVLSTVEAAYVEPVDRAKMVEGAIKGMVKELDPHSAYLPPDDFRIFRDDTEGRFGGIGVEVDLKDDAITVIAPLEGSPAHRAGIRSGDRIVAIDGQPVRADGLEALVRRLRGAPGTHVKLALRRAGQDAPVVVDLVREQIRVASVVAKRLEHDVYYLRLKLFQETTHDEMLSAIARLRQTGPASGVVLDLRNNPGGLVDQATEVADELLDGGTIYATRHRGAIVDEAHAHAGGALTHERLVVLVNEYSASAAELLAGALSDNHRATLVGTPTFGKGSVQTVLELPDGAGLKLTTMRYYTPSGRSIQAEGIRPDIVVEPAKSAADDALGVTRERDLAGHLPAEPTRAPRTPSLHMIEPGGPDGGTAGAIPAGVADLPDNPVGGADYALSVAYQVVRGTIAAPR